MERWYGKVAIVTGAGSGIGEAVSDSLVKYGVKVVGVGRREEKLKEVEKKLSGGKGKFYPLKGDITKEEDILNVFKWTEANLGAIHIMINNAGMIDIKKIEEQETEVWRQMYETNVISLQVFCREAVKSMKKNNVTDGHIINITSFVAQMSSPGPKKSTYFASKKAANAFTEGLRVELANERSDIRVSTINPGLTDTDILKPYREEIPEEIVKLAMKPSDVAETVTLVLQLPPHVVVSDLTVQPIRSIKLESQKLRQGKLEHK